MVPLLLAFLLPIGCVRATWQTLYSSNLTHAYVQSTNGSLYGIAIPAKGVSAQNVYEDLQPIATAPLNSSLVLDSDGHLFAVWGARGCGKSPIEISQYNPSSDQWTSLAQSGPSQLWHQDAQIVWIDRSNDTIYIYGGACNGQTQSGFYSYSLSNKTFNVVNAHGGAMPRDMSAAQVIPLDDYQTLILGGQVNGAWMSMQQIAIWGYGAWEFSSVSNSSNIDSRDDPLLLPLWQEGQTGSIDRVLVVGGTVAGRDAKPSIALLAYNETTGWVWKNTYANVDQKVDLSYGGLVLFETFASLSPEASSKVSLYGNSQASMLAPVQQVVVPKSQDKSGSGKKTSTAVVAVVSTILPIIALSVLGVAAWWWWRRRQERRLLLLPNRRSMLRMHDRTESTETGRSWVPPLQPRSQAPPPMHDSGSVVMMEVSNESQVYMSRQRRNLRVVNPDADLEEHPRSGNSSASGTRESSWSSGSSQNPFADHSDEYSSHDDHAGGVRALGSDRPLGNEQLGEDQLGDRPFSDATLSSDMTLASHSALAEQVRAGHRQVSNSKQSEFDFGL